MPALHQEPRAADREGLLDLLVDDGLRQQIALARVARPAVERAEVAVRDADVRVVEVPVDDERHPCGSFRRFRTSFATRPTSTRSRERSSAMASSSEIRSPSERPVEDIVDARVSARRRPSCGHLLADEPELGHVVELADVAGHLEEGVEARRARAARSCSGASRSSARGSPPDSRTSRSPCGRGAPAPSARGEPTRRARARARRGPRREARAPPRRRRPSAARSARARGGRGRSAASGPRTRCAAPRRRSGGSRPPPPEREDLRLREQERVRTTDVALSGVTATERTCPNGSRVTSWIESTAPSDETHTRGRIRSRSALRAYSIDEIGAMSISPSSSMRLSSVGTPGTSSTSASSR